MLKKVWRPWSAGTSLPDTFASKTAAQQDPHVGSPEVRPLTGWPGGMAVDWVISGIRNCENVEPAESSQCGPSNVFCIAG